VIGLDIGMRGIKLLQLDLEPSGVLKVVGAAAIDGSAPTSEAEHATLVRRIAAAVDGGGFTTKRCVVSLPRREAPARAVSLAEMPDEGMARAAAWEASQCFGLEPGALEADWFPTGAPSAEDGQREVIVVGVPHAALATRLSPIFTAGLKPIAVDAGFAALARFCRWHSGFDEDGGEVALVLDVGAVDSTMMVMRGGRIVHVRSIDVGGDRLDDAVRGHLHVESRGAAELRAARINANRQGIEAEENDGEMDRVILEAVGDLLRRIVTEVDLGLRQYDGRFSGAPPQHAMLVGFHAMEPALLPLLREVIDVPFVFDDDGGTLGSLIEPIRDRIGAGVAEVASAWATAVGLSLRGLYGDVAEDETEGEKHETTVASTVSAPSVASTASAKGAAA